MWFTRTANDQYAVNHGAMQQTDVGRKFWAFVTTVPLTLLTLANLFLALQGRWRLRTVYGSRRRV